MLSNDNISDILKAVRGAGHSVGKDELQLLVLMDMLEDKRTAYKMVYDVEKTDGEVMDYLSSPSMTALASAAKPFGVGVKDALTVTSEENMSAMVKMLNQIDAIQNGDKPDPDLIKLSADIRFKIQAKFDLQNDANEAKHLIVVPQKHDMICPHTNRECTEMPSKEACMEYYNLKE